MKVVLTITANASGQIIITPPPGVELVLSQDDIGASEKPMTVAEAAIKIGVSAKTMSRYCTAGRVVGAQLVGGNWLIPPSALDELSKQNLRPGRRAKKQQ